MQPTTSLMKRQRSLLSIFRRCVKFTYKDASIVRFNSTVTGHLEKEKLDEIEGMKTKVMFFFITVSVILFEQTEIHFTAGLRRTRPRAAYEVLRDGIGIDKF
ncbi:hypothetical protein RND71_021466 [Anisodus tanguticus]|uniref:Uncharacterized protein n=1 Tax=Anisodus tanguticus TaxID=243964 RepID=A0AAE1RY63_9SOLA|nr:hypothetical protein RND71_021466 [Anisodus tanguticus]